MITSPISKIVSVNTSALFGSGISKEPPDDRGQDPEGKGVQTDKMGLSIPEGHGTKGKTYCEGSWDTEPLWGDQQPSGKKGIQETEVTKTKESPRRVIFLVGFFLFACLFYGVVFDIRHCVSVRCKT